MAVQPSDPAGGEGAGSGGRGDGAIAGGTTETFHVGDAVEVLERTPRTLSAMLEGVSDPWVDLAEGPGTFTARDVVGHLLHGERTDWLPRIRRILSVGEAVPFEPFDRTGHVEACRGLGLGELLGRFATERAGNLRDLRGLELSPEDLDRRGIHPELGTVSLRMLLATWVVHDLGHVRQICRVMAGRYRSVVGPWQAYLPVLGERGSTSGGRTSA
jgi:hypothetical protein